MSFCLRVYTNALARKKITRRQKDTKARRLKINQTFEVVNCFITIVNINIKTMSRRTELEEEMAMVQKRIDNVLENTPEEVVNAWIKELDSISFELNNLYDDNENDFD